MVASHDHPKLVLPPPTYPAVLFVMAWVLDRHVIPPFIDGVSPAPWLGAILAILGLGAAVWAVLRFMHAGTHVEPHKPTLAMVMDGPFRFSRNPIYASFFALFAGVGMIMKLEWTIVFLPILWLCLRLWVIAPEEAFLSRRFGTEYEHYRQKVRRWL